MIRKEVGKNELLKIASFFDVEAKRIRPDMKVVGSPERTQFRVVFEDNMSKLFVLEEILLGQAEHKNKIASTLLRVHKKGLIEARPYLKSKFGEFTHNYQERFWQIIPYYIGVPLKRPEYVNDNWRGNACADFLLEFKEASRHIKNFENEKTFSLKDYVCTIRDTVKENHPSVLEFIDPVVEFLEDSFFKSYNQLKPSLCHGDFHPLNIIWKSDSINAVIDWEFVGNKPELYDVTNLIGCLGIENPEALYDGFAITLLKKLKENRFAPSYAFEILPEYIVAQRFAWLSEWFRKKYSDLLELEIDYMNLLIKQNKLLKEKWGKLGL